MLKPHLEKLMQQVDLQRAEVAEAINIVLANQTNTAQISAFLALLHAKTETVNEMLGIIDALRENMQPVSVTGKVLDIVGTGGDRANTVNISTASAILAASCGVKVAKHGNRAVSSQCGSADVLEKLGVNIDLTAEQVTTCINEVGIGFCFSPNFHPAMQQLRSVRKELGIPTSFNLLGPLLNPAGTAYNLIGVYNKSAMKLMAELFSQLGVERTLVVNGHGLDELSCLGIADAIEVTRHAQTEISIDPQKFGFKKCTLAELQGGDADKNAALLLAALSGQEDNAISQTIILNTAVSLWLCDHSHSIEAALITAKNKLQAGEAVYLLNQWIACSNRFKK